MSRTDQKRRLTIGSMGVDPSDMVWKEFRKLPVVVSVHRILVPFTVETLEGMMEGRAGDWLIKGVAGELYPCSDEAFRRTYEEV